MWRAYGSRGRAQSVPSSGIRVPDLAPEPVPTATAVVTVGSCFDVEQLLIDATTAGENMIAILGMRKAHGQKNTVGGYPRAGVLR